MEKKTALRTFSNLVGKILLSGLALSLTACGPSNQELAETIVAQTSVARELSTVAVAGALSGALTANPSVESTSSSTPNPIEEISSSEILQPTAFVSYGDVEIAVSSAAVRAGPGQEFFSLFNAGEGQRLSVAGITEAGDWLAVILPDGELGWILRRQVVPLANLAEAPIMIAPTPAPPVKITVVNNLGFTVILRIVELDRTMALTRGESETILVRPGIYSLQTLGINSTTFEPIIQCSEFKFILVLDITWIPRTETFCDVFP